MHTYVCIYIYIYTLRRCPIPLFGSRPNEIVIVVVVVVVVVVIVIVVVIDVLPRGHSCMSFTIVSTTYVS